MDTQRRILHINTNDILKAYPYILLMYGILMQPFSRIFAFILNTATGISSLGAIIAIMIWVVPSALFTVRGLKRLSVFRLPLCIISVSIVWFLLYLLFPVTRQYYDEYLTDILSLIFVGVPVAYLLNKTNDFYKLVASSRVMLRTLVVLLAVLYALGMKDYTGSMGWGKATTPVTLFYYVYLRTCTANTKPSIRRFDIFLFLISVFLTLMSGRQWLIIAFGGLLCCGLFTHRGSRRRLIGYFVAIAALILIYFFYSYIIAVLQAVINALGIKSRALESLLDNSLLDTYNRNSIYTYCKTIISENGNKVSGMFADRLYLRQYRASIAYAHNVFYELLIDFGTVLGGGLIGVIFISIIVNYLKCRPEYKYIYIVFFFACCIRYLVSSSIFIENDFIIFIGLMLNRSIKKPKRARKSISA